MATASLLQDPTNNGHGCSPVAMRRDMERAMFRGLTKAGSHSADLTATVSGQREKHRGVHPESCNKQITFVYTSKDV